MSKRNDPKPLGKNGVDMGARGVYDKRNQLNDLTGKEWVYFTNSVWITGYSPTAKENVGLKYRKTHPSPKPPALMKEIIEFSPRAMGEYLIRFVVSGGHYLERQWLQGNVKPLGLSLNRSILTHIYRYANRRT